MPTTRKDTGRTPAARWIALGLSAWAAPVLAAGPVAPKIAPVIDNDEVAVTDVALAPGEAGPATPPAQDAVVVFLEGGRVRTRSADGHVRVQTRRFGDAVFVPKGTRAIDEALGGRVHEVVVTLKEPAPAAVANTTGLPLAFPRPGSVKVLDNGRVTVWRYSWTPGAPTPMHFHDKDVVVAYRYDGTLKSVTPEGQVTLNPYKAGDIRFNKASRSHYEVLTTGRQSAMMVELKPRP
jgi:hypothetical protein